MTAKDPVRALLAARGCPPTIVAGGLAGLVATWDGIVASVERGYELTLDDYLNDMDLRDLIAAAVDVASVAERAATEERLARADSRLLAHTLTGGCLWGDDIALEEGLDPQREWWYYRRPVRPGEQLREDLHLWGLADS